MLYLDTHAIIYLYSGTLDLFSNFGRTLIQSETLLISPIILLELEYLYEIGKINVPSSKIYSGLKKDCGLNTCRIDFIDVIECAKGLTWTRDPFDRLIVAQALVNQSMLLTKDRNISDHYDFAKW